MFDKDVLTHEIPDICLFWHTTTLFRPVESTPKGAQICEKMAKIGRKGPKYAKNWCFLYRKVHLLEKSSPPPLVMTNISFDKKNNVLISHLQEIGRCGYMMMSDGRSNHWIHYSFQSFPLVWRRNQPWWISRLENCPILKQPPSMERTRCYEWK